MALCHSDSPPDGTAVAPADPVECAELAGVVVVMVQGWRATVSVS